MHGTATTGAVMDRCHTRTRRLHLLMRGQMVMLWRGNFSTRGPSQKRFQGCLLDQVSRKTYHGTLPPTPIHGASSCNHTQGAGCVFSALFSARAVDAFTPAACLARSLAL